MLSIRYKMIIKKIRYNDNLEAEEKCIAVTL